MVHLKKKIKYKYIGHIKLWWLLWPTSPAWIKAGQSDVPDTSQTCHHSFVTIFPAILTFGSSRRAERAAPQLLRAAPQTVTDPVNFHGRQVTGIGSDWARDWDGSGASPHVILSLTISLVILIITINPVLLVPRPWQCGCCTCNMAVAVWRCPNCFL